MKSNKKMWVWLGAGVGLVAVAATATVSLGVYNVAADDPHSRPVYALVGAHLKLTPRLRVELLTHPVYGAEGISWWSGWWPPLP